MKYHSKYDHWDKVTQNLYKQIHNRYETMVLTKQQAAEAINKDINIFSQQKDTLDTPPFVTLNGQQRDVYMIDNVVEWMIYNNLTDASYLFEVE